MDQMPWTWKHVAPILLARVQTFLQRTPRCIREFDTHLKEVGGLAQNQRNQWFVTDCNKHVHVFHADGQLATIWVYAAWGCHLYSLVCHHDWVLATDRGNHHVVVFQSDGTVVRTLGGWGCANGLMRWPQDVAVTHKNEVLVSDWDNMRIAAFQLEDGRFLRNVNLRQLSPTATRAVCRPVGLFVSARDEVYITTLDKTMHVMHAEHGSALCRQTLNCGHPTLDCTNIHHCVPVGLHCMYAAIVQWVTVGLFRADGIPVHLLQNNARDKVRLAATNLGHFATWNLRDRHVQIWKV